MLPGVSTTEILPDGYMKPPAPSLSQTNYPWRLRQALEKAQQVELHSLWDPDPPGSLFLGTGHGRRAAPNLKRGDLAKSRNINFVELIRFGEVGNNAMLSMDLLEATLWTMVMVFREITSA